MPLDPKRVQAIFWEAVQYSDLADCAVILDRECMDDSELRQRVETLLSAHDRFDDFVNQPLIGPDGWVKWCRKVSDTKQSGTLYRLRPFR